MKTYIIAEMAWAHDGSLDKAVEIMRGAKRAGADAIGIHLTRLEDYMVRYYGNGQGKVSAGHESEDIYLYLDRINLREDQWLTFGEEARKEGIDVVVMPNDMASLAFAAERLHPRAFVVPAASFVEEDFLRAVAARGTRTYFRIGGAHLGEVEQALGIFRSAGNPDVVLLHGIQMYPTPLGSTDLALLPSLKALFGVEVGLADHIDGGRPLARVLPLLAIPYGATCIEKHITLDREERGEDFEAALDPAAFQEFVEFVRAAETAIGSASFRGLSEDQLRYRDVSRKKMVAAASLEPGVVIGREHLGFKRCDQGLTVDQMPRVLGRQCRVALQVDDTITLDKLG